MKHVNRRKFVMLASVGATGAALSACGNDLDVEVNPTQIPDVPGAPPTLAPPAASPPAESTPAESGGDDAAAGGGGEPVVLEAQDPYAWSTTTLEAAPGQVIQVTNVGLGQHDFSVDEWGVNEPLPADEPVEITVPDDVQPGDTFVYYCSVAGHRENGMEGKLTIVEAAAPAPAAAAEESPAAGAAPSAGAGEPVMLEAADPYEWSAYTFEVAPGQVIQVTNTGLGQHDFSVDEWGVNEPLPPGEPVEVTVPDDVQPGDTFVYYCSIAGHRENGMEGELTIIEAAAAPAEEAPAAAAEESPAAGAAPAGGTGEPVELEADDPYEWSTDILEVAPGQVIQVTNVGLGQHDFSVDEWGVNEPLPAGEPVEITVPDDVQSGDTFVYYCSVAGHRENGMEGTITVL